MKPLQASGFLILEKIPGRPHPRIVKFAKRRPSLAHNQIACLIRMTLPADAFDRFFPVVNINVHDQAIEKGMQANVVEVDFGPPVLVFPDEPDDPDDPGEGS